MIVLSLPIAAILLDFRVVSKVTELGEIVGQAFGVPVDFSPLLVSLQPVLLFGIFVLWLRTFITIRQWVGKRLTVPI